METQQNTISRRNFLATAGVLTASAYFFPKELFAQAKSPVTTIIAEAAKSPVKVTSLRGNISIIEGSGGNILVFTGPDGKLMVDAGISVSEMKIKAALAKISKDPIKLLMNTHWHFDHASGNEWVHKAGASIIAHENTKKHLSTTVRVEDWNYTFPPAPKGALPSLTFADHHETQFNGEKIALQHYSPAHTDSDLSIHFPHADILHVADTWWNGHYPFIDYVTGGNIKGMIAAAEKNLKNTTKSTIIIPGHGPIGDRSQLVEYTAMLHGVADKVTKLKAGGASLKEVIASKPTKQYDAQFGTFVINGDFFTNLVYRGV
ncbi:MAG TPA: MBL fold metallo-hydrolase [Mucilaginibacter sp.]|jgi:glyoxylase-like metal-dependent hydrolase (beta-lactamase superfamily II)